MGTSSPFPQDDSSEDCPKFKESGDIIVGVLVTTAMLSITFSISVLLLTYYKAKEVVKKMQRGTIRQVSPSVVVIEGNGSSHPFLRQPSAPDFKIHIEELNSMYDVLPADVMQAPEIARYLYFDM